MPDDHELVKRAVAHAGANGVFNLYLSDKSGREVCHYDPKQYGKIRSGKENRIEMHEEIIGVYGTHPKLGERHIFSSFGLVLLSTTRHMV